MDQSNLVPTAAAMGQETGVDFPDETEGKRRAIFQECQAVLHGIDIAGKYSAAHRSFFDGHPLVRKGWRGAWVQRGVSGDYIDLNPVRAGMVKDPADYRWSSYGEAIGGGTKGNGKKAREGLVRAYFCDQEVGFEAGKWREVSRLYRRLMGLALGRKPGLSEVAGNGNGLGQITLNTAEMLESEDNGTVLKDLGMAKMLRCRVRYFTDGAVIGSKEFVNEAFANARERFGAKRKDGARAMRGSGRGARGVLWSVRDLRKGVTEGFGRIPTPVSARSG